MQNQAYELIVIGGSSGSVSAVVKIIPSLSAEFKIPIVMVLHRGASSKEGFISEILQHKSKLHIKEAEEKEIIAPATVYIAPADYHLLIENDLSFSLDASEKILFSRPSIDVTFESAAEKYGKKMIGILLTGANHDGAKGMAEIAQLGGLTIAQNPETAEIATMPLAAIKTGKVDKVMELEEIIDFLNSL